MEFSDIALTRFLRSYPELANMVVTFTDMSDELPEDKNIQFGVVILNGGGSMFYVPIIARGETVYPIDQVFLDDESKFFPLTPSFVDLMVNNQKFELGEGQKIPQTVDKNPSVQKMVNPPRTGKFVYASSGRLGELLATLPDHIKAAMRMMVLGTPELQNPLHKMFGLPEMLESLTPAPIQEEQEVTGEVPVRFYSGNNVPENAVQDVLKKGYAIIGEQVFPRVVTPAADASAMNCALQQISQADAGRAFDFLLKDGTTLRGAVMPNLRGASSTLIFFEDGSRVEFNTPHRPNRNPIGNRFVVTGTGENPANTIKSFMAVNPPSRITNVVTGVPFTLICDGKVVGDFTPNQVVKNSDYMTINVGATGVSRIIVPLTSDIGSPYTSDDVLYCTRTSTVLPQVGKRRNSWDMETSLRNAENVLNYRYSQTLPESMKIGFDGGDFAINGTPVGQEPDLMRILVINERIPTKQAEEIVKEAKEQGRYHIFLSKKADVGEGDTEPGIEQFGEQPPPQSKVWESDPLKQNLKTSVPTGDKQVVEATILSELLQDPNLYETIDSYLPDIAEAIDKLGRTLLLVRLNSGDIYGENGSNTLTSLLGSIRNTYKMLGDNYLKLEKLISNEPPEESQ